MANQVDVLEHQLRKVVNGTHLIVEAANNQPQLRRQNMMWRQHIIGLFGDTLFQREDPRSALHSDSSMVLGHLAHGQLTRIFFHVPFHRDF